MTEICRELGVYSAGSYAPPDRHAARGDPRPNHARAGDSPAWRAGPQPRIPPGICLPWAEKARELPEITGDRDLVREIWDEIEGLASTYIWQLLLAF